MTKSLARFLAKVNYNIAQVYSGETPLTVTTLTDEFGGTILQIANDGCKWYETPILITAIIGNRGGIQKVISDHGGYADALLG